MLDVPESNKIKQRCPWVPLNDPLYVKYHDEEWGRPLYDDYKIFEFLTLEVFQAGLSWKTVLYKRKNFQNAFDDFDFEKISRYSKNEIERLKTDSNIIRNELKILATINNSQKFMLIRDEFGSFSDYMWKWVEFTPIKHHIEKIADYPIYDQVSIAWAKDLKKRGFKFLGPKIIYAHMQSTGMVNDHSKNCFCSFELGNIL